MNEFLPGTQIGDTCNKYSYILSLPPFPEIDEKSVFNNTDVVPIVQAGS